ncbi:unnamed protein product, partial [Effrenium voratum]
AFAAILASGNVVTWGQSRWGGHSAHVQDQLQDVQQVVASSKAFAAVRADGRIVTWGDPMLGGNLVGFVKGQFRDIRGLKRKAEKSGAHPGDAASPEKGREPFWDSLALSAGRASKTTCGSAYLRNFNLARSFFLHRRRHDVLCRILGPWIYFETLGSKVVSSFLSRNHSPQTIGGIYL